MDSAKISTKTAVYWRCAHCTRPEPSRPQRKSNPHITTFTIMLLTWDSEWFSNWHNTKWETIHPTEWLCGNPSWYMASWWSATCISLLEFEISRTKMDSENIIKCWNVTINEWIHHVLFSAKILCSPLGDDSWVVALTVSFLPFSNVSSWHGTQGLASSTSLLRCYCSYILSTKGSATCEAVNCTWYIILSMYLHLHCQFCDGACCCYPQEFESLECWLNILLIPMDSLDLGTVPSTIMVL